VNILVIKLSALGDFVLAMAAFRAIRAHHADARITLLTTAPYVGLARASAYFDEVWVDSRPKAWHVAEWLKLRRRLRGGGFARVYDLQANQRTDLYFRLFGRPRPEWSGLARGCSHPDTSPSRTRVHTVERHDAQLALAGVPAAPGIDLSWSRADIERFGLPGRFALLVPGGSAHRPEKRWPAAHYTALCSRFSQDGIRPVLIGGAAERDVLAGIARHCPAVLDLCGETSFEEIIALARAASAAVGNDTGPMHLIGAAGCPSVVLFSDASNPVVTAPHGPSVTIFREPSLADLAPERVIAGLHPLLSG
jgi:ADP-heptose:LPS heptosyltransferase